MTLWRVRATLDDRPGFLAVLTASLALKSVNILAVQVHATEQGAVDEFLVDAPDALTEPELVEAIQRGRGRDAWVVRTDARGLVDPPTQALGIAARLVRDPAGLAAVLATMLDADVTWRPSTVDARLGVHRTSMVLPDPHGGALLLRREAPIFTPAEYARAQALVALARTVDRPGDATLLLPDGTELTIRPSTVDDAAAVRALHDRCTPESLRRRYLSGAVPDAVRLLGRGYALVALVGERLVAIGHLVGEGALGELAVLVEDAFQRRGIGTAILRRLVAHAATTRRAAVLAHTHADNAPLLRTLRRLDLSWGYDRDGALVTAMAGLAVGASVPRSASA